MKAILAATAVVLSLFITTNAWTQSGQGPAGAPPGTPPGTLKVYPLDEAKQLQNGANAKPTSSHAASNAFLIRASVSASKWSAGNGIGSLPRQAVGCTRVA